MPLSHFPSDLENASLQIFFMLSYLALSKHFSKEPLKHHVEITKFKGLDYTIKGTPKVIVTIS